MSIKFSCDQCGATLQAQKQGAGKRTKCPKCGKKLLIPKPLPRPEMCGAASLLDEELSRAPQAIRLPDVKTSPQSQEESAAPSRSPGLQCPTCHAPMSPGDVFCDHCGMSIITGTSKALIESRERGKPWIGGSSRVVVPVKTGLLQSLKWSWINRGFGV